MTNTADHSPNETCDHEREPSWESFLDAIHTNVHSSCCAFGGGGSIQASRFKPPHAILTRGREVWASALRPRRAIVTHATGSFILPSVRLHEPGNLLTQPVDMLISEGRIAAITPPLSTERSARVIGALRGQVVAPALCDLHVHMPPANALQMSTLFLLLTLRHGVVRVRDAGDPDGTSTPAALELVLSGALPGPDIHYAYAFIGDGPNRWGNTMRCANPADAPTIVGRLRHAGASWLKAYENLDAARIAALVAAAQDAGLGVMGHVPTRLSIEEALLPDAQHCFGVPAPTTLRRDHVLNRSIDWQSVTPERIASVVEACVRNRLAITPTLSTSRNLLRLERWEQQRDAEDVRLLPRVYPDVIWHPKHGLPAFRNISRADFDRARDAYDRKLALVGALSDAGVSLRLGTDTQQPFVVPGVSLHEELECFEQAGISRANSWRWASQDAARVLGIVDTGKLQVGQRADLIVSDSSPFERGWSSRGINATICGGVCVMRSDLDTAISGELARFEGRIAGHVSRWLARFALDKAAKHFVA